MEIIMLHGFIEVVISQVTIQRELMLYEVTIGTNKWKHYYEVFSMTSQNYAGFYEVIIWYKLVYFYEVIMWYKLKDCSIRLSMA